MVIAIVIIAAIFLFLKTSTPPVNKNLGNSGGTSTPTPTSNIPVFYQQDNSATAQNPSTTLSVDKTGANILKPIEPVYPIKVNPIPIESISYAEQTSNAEEQALSYYRNGLLSSGDAIRAPYSVLSDLRRGSETFGSDLVPLVTNNSPSSVPSTAPTVYQSDAASIAPNPPANPTLESTIPKIAATISTPIRVPTISLQRQNLL